MENKVFEFICVDNPDINKVINYDNKQFEDGSHDWRHYAGGIYLHGKVEYANHFDCVELINFDGLTTYKETDSYNTTIVRCDYPTGIFDAKVYGYNNKCKVFIWSNKFGQYKQFHGLIVDVTDTKSYEYAKLQYEKKSITI